MKGKRILALSLSAALTLSLLGGCAKQDNPGSGATPTPGTTSQQPSSTPTAGPVDLTVVTTYAGEDSNAKNFQANIKAWEAQTGNKVIDNSETASEQFKARVRNDFQTGSEPDVLFFFNGVDSNSFVEAGKVVSIDEIRSVYPDYATNMKDGMLGASPVDGKNYSVPMNGYWEAMFVNKTVLEAAGAKMPDATTTWDEFLEICQTIKDAGYTPLAASLGNIPHYWFENCIYNQHAPVEHDVLPALPTKGSDGNWSFDTSNAQYKAWVAGINEVKDLYERGFFPQNTLSATDDETFAMFTGDQAAFLIDGSWKVGGIENACGKDDDNNVPVDESLLANFTVTYVPGKGDRKATDILGGLSSGFFITKKAWDDPAKREAAVNFVQYMTSDDVLSAFAGATTTALNNGVAPEYRAALSSLGQAGMALVDGATGISAAVQDRLSDQEKVPLFVPGMAEIVSGQKTAEQGVQECLIIIAENQQ